MRNMNNKKEVTPLRTRKGTVYQKGTNQTFKISRSKFSNFLDCKRCFYLERVKGLKDPSMPGWSLNSAVDELLKKEFDICREKQIPHRLFKDYGLEHLVPFKHEQIDAWRDAKARGLVHRFEDTNILLSGGIDDIWQDAITQELIVVDYKSQASREIVGTETYLKGIYHQGYKIQLDFYNYLLSSMGFKIGATSYFLVVNADTSVNGFHGNMKFSETIIPYKHDISWIPSKVREMITLMNQEKVPEGHESCENCAYARERVKFDI